MNTVDSYYSAQHGYTVYSRYITQDTLGRTVQVTLATNGNALPRNTVQVLSSSHLGKLVDVLV